MEIQNLPTVAHGGQTSVYDAASFDHYQRIAIALSKSALVPTMYQGQTGIPNCLIALEISLRVGMPAFMIMQNMDVLHGRPAFRSQFKIALVNSHPRFNSLEFEYEDRPGKTVKYVVWEGVKPNRRKLNKEHVLSNNRACRAWTTDKSGKKIFGPWISIELAIQEGWFFRDGSKWGTMQDKMLGYRAGSWFADMYIPEASMGMKTEEEVLDIAFTEVDDAPKARQKAQSARLDELNAPPIPPTPVEQTAQSAGDSAPKSKDPAKIQENAPEPETGGDADEHNDFVEIEYEGSNASDDDDDDMIVD